MASMIPDIAGAHRLPGGMGSASCGIIGSWAGCICLQ